MAAHGARYTVPDLFGVVHPQVYRSDSPKREHFPFLQRLTLRTVLVLSPEKPLRELTEFLTAQGVQTVHLGLLPGTWHHTAGKASSWKPIRDEVIKEALEMVLDPACHPIALIDTSGIHQTSVVVACLRKLEGWCLTACLEEYRRFAGRKARFLTEQLIEFFDVDLVTLPEETPGWFKPAQPPSPTPIATAIGPR